ncbi:uncharacterized protein LOC116611466 [Nematostella vectensis]|uniref:uncharacterized protein LOC116611466 n=1 Tax=Nematostella vectensis TaxID=45351 RepID=UPI0020771532|nr:uncharacterized protein LOC116611466 [Nematostella vectensis]
MHSVVLSMAVFAFLQLNAMFVQGEQSCPAAVKVGCYEDKVHHRALGKLLFQDRSETGDRFSGVLIDWHHYDKYLEGLICRCATAAKGKGYTHFGLQFYGECHSAPNSLANYGKHGKSDNCVDHRLVECEDETSDHCVGLSNANYVYRVTGKMIRVLVIFLLATVVEAVNQTCSEDFYKLGCFRDSRWSRGMSELLINDRQRSSPNQLNWNDWNKYLPGLACRCAAKAREKGYTLFGIQFYGECWAGAGACDMYDQQGTSLRCVGQDFRSCDNSDNQACAGGPNANYVYLLTE